MPIHPQRTYALGDASVGEVARAARLCANIDQREAAVAAGMDINVLSRIERGARPCRVTELVALADVYHLPAERMLRAITGDEKVRARLKLAPEPAVG